MPRLVLPVTILGVRAWPKSSPDGKNVQRTLSSNTAYRIMAYVQTI